MYEIPDKIKVSVVYKGMRIILRAKYVNWFFQDMYKKGYTIKRCVSLVGGVFETPDITCGKLIFSKDIKCYMVTIYWYAVDDRDLLNDVYTIKSMEIVECDCIK